MTVEFYQQRLHNIVIRPEIHEEVGSYVFKTVLPFLFVTLYHASMLSILFDISESFTSIRIRIRDPWKTTAFSFSGLIKGQTDEVYLK